MLAAIIFMTTHHDCECWSMVWFLLENWDATVIPLEELMKCLLCFSSKLCFCYLFAASCVPPCQNGGMCLRPQLCVCKPGTKGKACETTVAQDTLSTAFGGNPGAAPSWGPSEQAAKHTSSKKAETLPRVSPVAQMTLTLKPKPAVGLSQQIRSQWVFCTCYWGAPSALVGASL